MNVLIEKPYIRKIIAVIKNHLIKSNRKRFINGRASDAFVYILSGSCEYTLENGVQFTVREGEVLYLSNQSFYTMEVKSEKYEYIYVDFLFEEGAEKYACAVYAAKSDCKALFNKLYRAYRHGGEERILACMRYLYEIYAMLSLNNEYVYLRGTLREKLDKVKEYIDQHYGDQDLSVGELSEKEGMSEVYFRRTFKAIYKTSPKKYIVSVRIEKAIQWMQYPFLDLKECARLCGFSSLQYFSKVFKEEIGETPAKYRRRRFKNSDR